MRRPMATVGVDIDAAQRAVAVDVGVDDGRDPGIVEAQREVERADLAGLGPALDRDPAVARIDADGDPAGKSPAGRPHQVGFAQRHGAEDHPVDARARARPRWSPTVADAAAELDRNLDRAQDRVAPPRR